MMEVGLQRPVVGHDRNGVLVQRPADCTECGPYQVGGSAGRLNQILTFVC